GVNPEIRKIRENISHADWVSSDGLTSINVAKNDAHFDNYSQRVLGGRYADKAAELVYNVKPEGAVVFSEANYTGRSVLLIKGAYDSTELEALGIPVGEISSLKITPEYKLTAITKKGAREFVGNNGKLPGILPNRIEVKKNDE